ncbi:hypothetical protein Q8F55_007373 [Vanrija albida]|uniref:Protein CPL1-like domain-containing protein n=1 Tax=Vanrija albida TaxID=181172 RepID=A0ABR3PTD8_9TREE
MKLSALIVAAFALPAALANNIAERSEPEAHVIAARQLEARTFISSGRCDMYQAAKCFVAGKNMDGNCNCVSPPFFQLPTPPVGAYTSYRDPVVLSKCWSNGQACGPYGNCLGTPVTRPPSTGTCNNWIQVSICEMVGKKTDGNCQCVSGAPTTPGNAGCGDPAIVGNCYKQKLGCSSKCVCTPIKPTTTSKAPAVTTTVAPGACQNWVAIATCELRGQRTDGNCNCIGGTPVTPGNNGCGDPAKVGNCYKQGWGCNAKCVCTPISSSQPPVVTSTVKPTTVQPTTPAPTTAAPTTSSPAGACKDWIAIATCELLGKKTDANCKCITGTPVTPGNDGCGDPAIVGTCYKKGWGCNRKCVCTGPSSSVAPTTTPAPTTTTKTTPAPTTAAPTTSAPASVCKDWVAIATCELFGKKTDANCKCIIGTPVTPGNGGCGDPAIVGTCYKKGWGCNKKCVCTGPSSSVAPTTPAPTSSTKSATPTSSVAPTTPAPTSSTKTATPTSSTPTTPTGVPGICFDWYKIAVCSLKGQKTDGNCNCIGGTPTTPGNSGCGDPKIVGDCWRKGWGCNSKCICTGPTTTVVPSTTVTATPTATPTQVGQCKDAVLIKWCAITGRGVNPDCTCMAKCGCLDQWACHAKGGKLDATCKCVVPSSAVKRRDAEFVKNLCPNTMKACRIDSEELGFNGRFECVDITSNIESCGGCVGEGAGQDCTAIEGASDVSCVQSKCVVSSCQRGWELSADGRCTPSTNASKFQQKVWGI